MNSKVCPPCVNNVAEYAELFKEKELFIEPILVFVDEEDSVVERFIAITGLNMPIKILLPEDAGSLNREPAQKLLFVDIQEQTGFYELDIPNVTIPVTYKKEELHEVSMEWEHLFGNGSGTC